MNLSGKIRADGGTGVNGITAYLLETGADLNGTQQTTDTTDTNGTWNFTLTTADLNDTYDVKLVSSSGAQVRYIPWSDEITLKTVDASVMKVRGLNSAAAPLYFFADRGDDAGDGWRMQATNSNTFAIGSNKNDIAAIIDYITITNGATAADSNTTILGQLTVGVDDTGADVKFFGASAGAFMLYDESADTLEVRGPSADAITSTGKLLLSTALTDINASDVIGKIDFQAPLEAGGTDAILVAASIQAVAQGTFSASVNATDLIFYTGHSEAATEKFRFTSQGELGIGGATYGSSGDVLTSGGAGAAASWTTPSATLVTGVTAGVGLGGGGTEGTVTLTLDLSELSTVTPADGDFFSTLDSDGTNEQKTTTTALATLFAGTGLTASSSVIGVDASQTQITSVGALGAGSITSGFTSIDVGSGAIAGGSFDASDGDITAVGNIALDSISAAGTDINIAVDDNSATALTIKQGSDAYLIIDTANSSESVSIGTGISGTVVTIGHTDSEVTIADNLTVSGNLTVTGTQTIVDTVTMNAANALVFEGATADAHETTLTIIDPTTDRTVSMPNQSGYLPVLAAASTTQISATPEELNVLDAVTAGTVSENLGVVVDGSKNIGTFGTVTAAGFTVGDTVITDGVITDTSGLSLAANVNATGTITGSGVLSIDDTTESTSTTTGSIHTDGGLGVAGDIYAGDDIFLPDAGVINWGAGGATITHTASGDKLIIDTGVGGFGVSNSTLYAFGTAPNANYGFIHSGTRTANGGGNEVIFSTQGTLTMASAHSGAGALFSPTFVEHSSGTHGYFYGAEFGLTVTAGSAATTLAATVVITEPVGPAVAEYALIVDSGNSRFDGQIVADGGMTVNSKVQVDKTELTIASGAVTVTRGYHFLDTEESDASGAGDDTDILTTVNGGVDGMVVIFSIGNNARTVTLDDAAGNLQLAGDFVLDDIKDSIMLVYDSSLGWWRELSRSNNQGG